MLCSCHSQSFLQGTPACCAFTGPQVCGRRWQHSHACASWCPHGCPPGAQAWPAATQWGQVLHGWRCAGSVRRGPEGTSPRTPGPRSPFCLPGGAEGAPPCSGLRPQWCRERTTGVQVALEAQSAYGNFRAIVMSMLECEGTHPPEPVPWGRQERAERGPPEILGRSIPENPWASQVRVGCRSRVDNTVRLYICGQMAPPPASKDRKSPAARRLPLSLQVPAALTSLLQTLLPVSNSVNVHQTDRPSCLVPIAPQ